MAKLAMLCFPMGTAKVAEFFARQAQAAAVQRGSGRAAARNGGHLIAPAVEPALLVAWAAAAHDRLLGLGEEMGGRWAIAAAVTSLARLVMAY